MSAVIDRDLVEKRCLFPRFSTDDAVILGVIEELEREGAPVEAISDDPEISSLVDHETPDEIREHVAIPSPNHGGHWALAGTAVLLIFFGFSWMCADSHRYRIPEHTTVTSLASSESTMNHAR